MEGQLLAAFPLEPFDDFIVRYDEFVAILVPLDEICKRERVATSHKTRTDGFNSFTVIGVQEQADRNHRMGIPITKRQRQDRVRAFAPGLSAFEIADLAKTVTQNGPIAFVAGRRIEVDEVVIVSRNDHLKAIENGALARAGWPDDGDHTGDVEIEHLEDVPVVE